MSEHRINDTPGGQSCDPDLLRFLESQGLLSGSTGPVGDIGAVGDPGQPESTDPVVKNPVYAKAINDVVAGAEILQRVMRTKPTDTFLSNTHLEIAYKLWLAVHGMHAGCGAWTNLVDLHTRGAYKIKT